MESIGWLDSIMQFDLAKEMSGLRHLLLSIISENQSPGKRRRSETEAIRLLHSRCETRFDKLETEISLIRSDSKAILNKIEALISVVNPSEKLESLNQSDELARSLNGNEHFVVMNRKGSESVATARTPLYFGNLNNDRRGSQGLHNALSSGNFSLTADIILDNNVMDSQRSSLSVVTPSGPIGNESDIRNSSRRARISSGTGRTPHVNSINVNRFKSLRDHVEHTKSELEDDSDSDDDGRHSTALSSASSCLKAIAGCKWRRTFLQFFGITKPDIFANDPGSRAIHPASPFMAGVVATRGPCHHPPPPCRPSRLTRPRRAVIEFTSAMLLVYCIGVVPVQLSFWANLGSCQRVPTMEFDMFVDLFFLVPILSSPHTHAVLAQK